MKPVIRLGTRDSELALWQAGTVQEMLQAMGHPCELVPVKATGDLQLDKPLYDLGITGIFTKTLDLALINGEIDIAVHSLKDVPTLLPKGIVQAAVPERGNPMDILVHKDLDFLNGEGVVATGSPRRKAQWLHRYPMHTIEDLRGNVNTRLQKLDDNDWNAAIFAAAGLERIGKLPDKHTTLHWMVPAPAQGAMVVMARAGDIDIKRAVYRLNHGPTELCTWIEREFLRELEGGCTAPIGALATLADEKLHFRGILLSPDGQEKFEVDRFVPITNVTGFGKLCAREILEKGGDTLMNRIRKEMSRE